MKIDFAKIRSKPLEFPEFKGECWSYADAVRRCPEAWTIDVIQGDGWSRDEKRCIAPLGLGRFERQGKGWVYIAPNGYAQPVRENYGQEVPPPLPKPISQRRQATCDCGPHTCGRCGQPNWIELHGVADGYCTYCYHAG